MPLVVLVLVAGESDRSKRRSRKGGGGSKLGNVKLLNAVGSGNAERFTGVTHSTSFLWVVMRVARSTGRSVRVETAYFSISN